MGRYIIRRILQAIPLLFLLTIFMFTLIYLLPGGPDQVIFNPHFSPLVEQRFGRVLGWINQYQSSTSNGWAMP